MQSPIFVPMCFKHRMYRNMLQAQSISIYIPSSLRDLKLDLVAVTS